VHRESESLQAKMLSDENAAMLSGSLCSREEIAIEKAPDTLDTVQLAGEREVAIRNPDRDPNMLRQVDQSLARIADGSYGICQRCADEISPKRLQPLLEFVYDCCVMRVPLTACSASRRCARSDSVGSTS
jgi:DnaK suppressor protein